MAVTIAFDAERWEQVRATYRRWWDGTLERPLLPVVVHGRDPGRPKPEAPLLSQATCADLSVPADVLIDRLDYELSCRWYLGDAFPFVNLDAFGPGVIAAFLGARLDTSTGQVWFHPAREASVSELRLQYDPHNRWLKRIKEICAAAMNRWQGGVLVGMTDLGGNLDVLSAFRPGQALPLDLVDAPGEVKRLTWDVHELWHRFFTEINEVLQPVNPGFSTWCGIYAETPFYILQCDFAYMISPSMFVEFALPELVASSRRLDRCFYHLDGRGQLPHLDSILAVESIDGVQWVPGAGAPGCGHWPEVYERIFASGKKTQVLFGWNDTDDVLDMLDRIGTGPGVHCLLPGYGADTEEAACRLLARYGIGTESTHLPTA